MIKRNEEFFEWLRSTKQLDRYEAVLDISEDYTGDQKYRLDASNLLMELHKKFNLIILAN